jgi:hypothetical protein
MADFADAVLTEVRKRTAGRSESGSSTQTSRFIPFAEQLSANFLFRIKGS